MDQESNTLRLNERDAAPLRQMPSEPIYTFVLFIALTIIILIIVFLIIKKLRQTNHNE